MDWIGRTDGSYLEVLEVLEDKFSHFKHTDGRSTNSYLCFGPINSVLNLLVRPSRLSPMADRSKQQSQVIGRKSVFILVYEGKGNGGKSEEVAILFQ